MSASNVNHSAAVIVGAAMLHGERAAQYLDAIQPSGLPTKELSKLWGWLQQIGPSSGNGAYLALMSKMTTEHLYTPELREVLGYALAVGKASSHDIAHHVAALTGGHSDPEAPAARNFPAPMGMRELIEQPEPEDRYLFEGLMPQDANVLISGYPKSHKTNFLLEIGVAGATATPFLGRFTTPKRCRIGLVLMEDRAHRVRKRLERICKAHGAELGDLESWLFIWFRPPLKLSHAATMQELGDWVEQCELDALFVDNWSYVSTGKSNDSDDVTPQLDALARLRDRRPIVAGLVQHAKKADKDADGTRLTDIIRNSGAFGAWYDAGFVLGRKDEHSPVTVRSELRDLPSPEAFAFTVEDQFPAGPEQGSYPGGWLRLQVSEKRPEQVQREAAADKFRQPVIDHLRVNPGCSKRQLRDGIPGDNDAIEAAFQRLCADGLARFDPPPKTGQGGRCWLMSPTVLNRAETVLTAHSGDRADRAAPSVGGQGKHGHASAPVERQHGRGADELEEVFDAA